MRPQAFSSVCLARGQAVPNYFSELDAEISQEVRVFQTVLDIN